MQWSNFYGAGLTEQITLVNAFGMATNFTINNFASSTDIVVFSTMKVYWTPLNDFWAVSNESTAMSGMSLSRETSNFYENFNLAMEQIMMTDDSVPTPLSPMDKLTREALGPFGSIDMKHVIYPSSLVLLRMNVTRIVMQTLLNNVEAQAKFLSMDSALAMSPFPASWRNGTERPWRFAGGNPLCSVGTVVEYVQQPILFEDQCSSTMESSIEVSRLHAITSLMAMSKSNDDEISSFCAAGLHFPDTCVDGLTNARDFIDEFISEENRQLGHSLAIRVHQDLVPMAIELIQYAVDATNKYELLHQPVFEADFEHPWNLFGWLFAMDWVLLNREVIQFEGDDGSMTLMPCPGPWRSMDPKYRPTCRFTFFGLYNTPPSSPFSARCSWW